MLSPSLFTDGIFKHCKGLQRLSFVSPSEVIIWDSRTTLQCTEDSKKNNRTKFFCCFFLDNSVQICVGSVIGRSNVSNFNNPSGGRPRLDHRDKIQFRRVHFGVFDVSFRASGTQLGSDTYSNSNFKPHKGTFQKLLSGSCPLRGGGVPPLSAKGFWAGWLSVKGGRGVPPNSAKENSAKKQVF